MLYKCDNCNFTTHIKINYNKHCKTQKHIEKVNQTNVPQISTEPCGNLWKNVENNTKKLEAADIKLMNVIQSQTFSPLQCSYCFKTFSRKDSASRHMNTCSIKKQNVQECSINSIIRVKELEFELEKQKMKAEFEKKELQFEKEKLELKLKCKEELTDEIKNDKEFQQKVIASGSMNLDSALKVSMNAITYLNKYHTNTPPLLNFNEEFKDPFVVYAEGNIRYDGEYYIIDDEYIEKEQYIIDKILVLEENNDTVRFFAWLIEKIYKNEKYPHLQAYWAKDTTRNNFTVRECIGDNNQCQWFPDQDGKIIINKVITPLLKFTVSIIKKGNDQLAKLVEEKKKDRNLDCLVSILKKQACISAFINKVNKDQLQEEIIKKMASAFHLDVSKQLAKRKITPKKLI